MREILFAQTRMNSWVMHSCAQIFSLKCNHRFTDKLKNVRLENGSILNSFFHSFNLLKENHCVHLQIQNHLMPLCYLDQNSYMLLWEFFKVAFDFYCNPAKSSKWCTFSLLCEVQVFVIEICCARWNHSTDSPHMEKTLWISVEERDAH